MKAKRLIVIEPLRLISIRKRGKSLRLAVRDHQSGSHIISFHFERDAEARLHGFEMKRWIAEQTPLAYVRGREQGALIDVNALLSRASG